MSHLEIFQRSNQCDSSDASKRTAREGLMHSEMADKFRVRFATVDDAEVISRHRARMFQDRENCRRICPKLFAPVLATNCVICFTRPLRRLAAQFGKCTKQIIAGAGVHLRRVLPHPVKNAATFADGRDGVIVNVFTEPEWRRK